MKKRFVLLIVLCMFLPLTYAEGCTTFIGDDCAELTWEEVPLQSGEVAEIVISPSNPNIMYAGFEVNTHSLYKSIDGGKNWRRIDGGGDHTKDVAVSPANSDVVYFAMSESLETTDKSFRSTARGMFSGPANWERETQLILSTGIPPGGSSVSFSSVEVFAKDENIIYAARKGGLYGPFGSGQGITPKIYKSIDRGQSWNEIEPNLPEINVLAIHPQDHNTILIGSRDGVDISKDSGTTLSRLVKFSNVISLAYQMDNPNVIYAASASKVLKSTDGGKNWQEITGNLEDIHRVRVSKSHPEVLYASTFNGVFRSNDAGNNWFDVSGNLAKNIQIVEIHPQNPDIAFIGHSSLWSSVRAEERYKTGLLAHQGIFKTEDGGKTWTRVDNGVQEYQFEEVAINPNKPFEAWVLSPASRGGYKTEDGGHHWRLTQTPTFHYPMRVKYSQQNPKVVFATGWQNGAPFSSSDDGGVTWNFISENTFFSGLNRGAHLKSGRGGQAIHLHGLAVDSANDNIVYAGSIHDPHNPVNFLPGAHIFKSEDGGKTWTESDIGFPHEEKTAIHDITIDPKNTQILYVATTSHESERGIGIYKSVDAGKSWNAVNNGLENLDIGAIVIHPFRTNELLAATHGGMYKSMNSGESWIKKSDVPSFDVELVFAQPEVAYASTGGGVLKSRDFGENWYEVNYDLPQGAGQGIGVDPTGDVIYTAIKDEGLYIARLTDVPPKDLPSEFSEHGYRGDHHAFEFPEERSSEPGFFTKLMYILVTILKK